MKALNSYKSMLTSHPLGRRHPLRCLSRILRWQLLGRVPGATRVVKYVGDLRLVMSRGQTGLTVHYYTGLYEFEDMLFVTHALRPGDLFIDVGANGGAYALLAAGVAGADVVAIEPVRDTFNLLGENVALNDLGHKIRTIKAAAGSVKGTVTMTSDSAAENHISNEDGSGGEVVQVIRLDDLDLDESTANIIKIDVEGWESQVVSGGLEMIRRDKPTALVVEFNQSGRRYGFNDADTINEIMSLGYHDISYDPWTRNISKSASRSSPNRIFVNDLDFFNERIKLAASVRVWGHEI